MALYYARTGNTAKAQALLDWLDARLFDPARGLYLDGIRIRSTGETVLEEAIYTYNQGPVLGALLELGGPDNLGRASTVVRAVAEHLTLPDAGGRKTGNSADPASDPTPSLLLRCDGTGDGGLFTGILTRYLALAANDERLPQDVRTTAAGLVTGTAGALWAGRRLIAAGEPLGRHGRAGEPVFSFEPRRPASDTYPPGAAVELSTQLQAWMALEAVASVAAASAAADSKSGTN